MRKKGLWKENLVTVMEVPRDLAYGDAIITITGPGLAVIENYRSILSYTSEKLIVLTAGGRVTICGTCLEIPCYTPMEMQITGVITGVFPERV